MLQAHSSQAKQLQFSARFYGVCNYKDGLRIQDTVLNNLKDGVILGFEHPEVITLGVRGDQIADLEPTALNTEIIKVSRGGQAVLHNLGQLVIYPCLNLKNLNLGARSFVHTMTKITAATLLDLAIDSKENCSEPGLFVDGKKIAAFGYRINRGVSSHGIAINVSNRLSDFEKIRTCGVKNQEMTSVFELKQTKPALSEVFELWMKNFKTQIAKEAGSTQLVYEDRR